MKKIFLLFIILSGLLLTTIAQNSALNFQNLDYMTHGDFVYCGHPYTTQLTNKITVALWIKWTTGSQSFTISPTNHEDEGDYSTYISYSAHNNTTAGKTGTDEDLMFTLRNDQNGNKTQFFVKNSSGTIGVAEVNTAFTVGQWYYIAGVYDGSLTANNLTIYVKTGATTLTATSSLTNGGNLRYNTAYRLSMGRMPWGYGFFVGHMDEARIWNTALTSAEITAQMNQATTVQDGACISYWRFENTLVPATPGTTITDAKSTAHGKFYSCLVDVHSFNNSGTYWVQDNDKNWSTAGTNGYWAGYNTKTVSGEGIDQENKVLSNSAIQMNFEKAFNPAPVIDSKTNTGDTWFGIENTTETSQWVSSDAPYPVELSLFEGKVSYGKVILHWTTATEVSNFGFYVETFQEKSEKWENLGFVHGNGNSNSPKEYSFIDDPANSSVQRFSNSLRYRLKQVDNDGSFSYSQEVEVLNPQPSALKLSQNYPNPFNPSTVISYQIPVSSNVTLKLFDVLGNEVTTLVNEMQEAGNYDYKFSIQDLKLTSGVYYYQLRAGSFVSTKKMILMK